tara:strand:- start:626 stop:802 length:177 start_codon:yes stop_codon:yes gene_type:complete
MIKVLGAIISIIKLILNVKKWITMPYSIYKVIRDKPKEVFIGIVIVLVGCGLYMINVL